MKKMEGYEVVRVIMRDGTTQFYNEGSSIYFPETEDEVKAKIYKITPTFEGDAFIFDPHAFVLKKIGPSEVQPEEEIPEEDR